MKKSQYSKLTAKQIEEYLKEITYGKSKSEPKFTLWAFGTIDENGKIRCGFLEEFDKAMKESIKKEYGSLEEGTEEKS